MRIPPRSTGAPPAPSGSGRRALAIASLVCGVLGLLTSVVVVGALVALIGLILGAIHLRTSRESRMMGWTGVWLSVLAMVAAAGFFGFYVFGVRSMANVGRGPFPVGMNGGLPATVGQTLPDFGWATLDGEAMRLGDCEGRRVVLALWATWCAACVQEVPHLVRLSQELGTNDVVVVALSTEDRVVLKDFARRHQIPYVIASLPVESMPPLLQQVSGLPTTVFLDRQGKVEHVLSGPFEYEELKARALGGQVAPSP